MASRKEKPWHRHHGWLLPSSGMPLSLLVAAAAVGACNSRRAPIGTEPEYKSQSAEQARPSYIFCTHPLVSQERAFELFTPILERMNRRIPNAHFELQSAPDYQAYEQQLYDRRYHFSLPNPLQTIGAVKRGYHVFGKVSNDARFVGIVLAKRDRKLDDFEGLKGLKVSYPGPTAVAACMLPQLMFTEHGIDISRDLVNIFTGNQESTIDALATGISDVAVTWPPPWKVYQRTHPKQAAEMRIVWTTPPLVNNGLVARNDVPSELVRRVAEVLFTLKDDDEGRRVLDAMGYDGFEAASVDAYRPVEEFLDRFRRRVRPITNQPQ